jgi:hypothetical protein
MLRNILIEILGESENLKVLGFLMANPFEYYSIVEVSKFSGVSRDTARKYLTHYIEKGYIIGKGSVRKKYKLDLKNPTIQSIKHCMMQYVDDTLEIEERVSEACPDTNFIENRVLKRSVDLAMA